MKKKMLFVIGAMLMMMAGTVLTACSSDDDLSDLMNDKLKLFEDSTMIMKSFCSICTIFVLAECHLS